MQLAALFVSRLELPVWVFQTSDDARLVQGVVCELVAKVLVVLSLLDLCAWRSQPNANQFDISTKALGKHPIVIEKLNVPTGS